LALTCLAEVVAVVPVTLAPTLVLAPVTVEVQVTIDAEELGVDFRLVFIANAAAVVPVGVGVCVLVNIDVGDRLSGIAKEGTTTGDGAVRGRSGDDETEVFRGICSTAGCLDALLGVEGRLRIFKRVSVKADIDVEK
jgi:hypothetical protein